MLVVGPFERLMETERQNELVHRISERVDRFGEQAGRSGVEPADELDEKIGAVSLIFRGEKRKQVEGQISSSESERAFTWRQR